jgi:putative ABC transport system permease protein
MLRNKLGVVLIGLQIAFTMTVMVNAIYIINERSRLMARPSGLDEPNTFYLTSVGYGDSFNEERQVERDLQLLRGLPGVVAATFTNAIPVSTSGSSTGVSARPGDTESFIATAQYRVDEHALEALDLELVAGRNFVATDVRNRLSSDNSVNGQVIITLALAEQLFPDDPLSAVNNTMYVARQSPTTIIGIVDRLQTPWPDSDFLEQSTLIPENAIDSATTYLIRTEPGQRDRLMAEVENLLADSGDPRIIRNLRSLEETRAETYRVDSVMATILTYVISILVFITAMGIVGLAVFGINRRRKQIGTRRALGATQGDVLRYFLLENLLITGMGVVLGAVLTIGFNVFLVQSFNLPRIQWYYPPLGMLVLLVVGQLSVLGPANRASRIPPALATRSV